MMSATRKTAKAEAARLAQFESHREKVMALVEKHGMFDAMQAVVRASIADEINLEAVAYVLMSTVAWFLAPSFAEIVPKPPTTPEELVDLAADDFTMLLNSAIVDYMAKAAGTSRDN